MKQFLAIVVYRCLVSGQPSGALDVQVRFYVADAEDEVRARIEAEAHLSYGNVDGEQVVWELREVMAVEEFAGAESGDEVVGFIAKLDELRKLA